MPPRATVLLPRTAEAEQLLTQLAALESSALLAIAELRAFGLGAVADALAAEVGHIRHVTAGAAKGLRGASREVPGG